jgi:hypothetical protein
VIAGNSLSESAFGAKTETSDKSKIPAIWPRRLHVNSRQRDFGCGRRAKRGAAPARIRLAGFLRGWLEPPLDKIPRQPSAIVQFSVAGKGPEKDVIRLFPLVVICLPGGLELR